MDVKQSLDEISREVDELKSRLTNADNNGEASDSNNRGQQTNAATGEIDKIRKIVELLETVVLPIVVDGQKSNPVKVSPAASIASVTAVASEPIKIIPKGLRLLQHHSGIISDIDDGPQITIEKALFQSDDN